MVWYFVVAVVAFTAGVVVGAWLMQRRTLEAAAAPNGPVRLPSQSEFLARADGPVGPDHPPAPNTGPIPGPAQDRDQPPT